MLTNPFILGLLAASTALALPAISSSSSTQSPAVISERSSDDDWTWDQGARPNYTIHSSCNSTEQHQLRRAISDLETLSGHARDHIRRWGNSSAIFTKYFGTAGTAEPVGWYDRVASGEKGANVFRCDDPENKCYQAGWGGYWRGAPFVNENNICPLSFQTRWYLEEMCAHGYNVSGYSDALYWGGDLLHRVFHTNVMGEGIVDHYADTFPDVLQLAKTHPEQAVRNSVTLRRFAVEAYAYDIAVPGEGCSGDVPGGVVDGHKPATSGAATNTVAAATAAATAVKTASSVAASGTTAAPATPTQAAASECHTHADGVVHCA